ncbi:MAG: FAD/NAD(P)-binding protein, partial [Candidatus Acidiferrales bacterium]
MTDETKPDAYQPQDKLLGMDQAISRRDFLNAGLLASGGLLMTSASPLQLLPEDDWTGYGGVGDYSRSNGNTYEIVQAGHRIRDGEFEKIPAAAIDTRETYDCVVVGGGISGLAAALFFLRQAGAGRTCLVLDNHPIFGGEAKGNEFLVDGHRLLAHQGSAVYFVQYPHSFIARFYDSIGLKAPKLQYQSWAGPSPEIPLSKTPYDMVGSEPATYGFYFGAKFDRGGSGVWLIDPWGKKLQGAPISETARAELLQWRRGPLVPEKRPQYYGDDISRQLDQITLEEHMMRLYGISRETIRTFLSPVEGGGSGLGPDVLSAYADYAADMLHPLDTEDGDQMFPRGNGDIARLMMKALISDAISGADNVDEVCNGRVNFAALDRPGAAAHVRLGATAVWVQHDGDPAKAEFVSIIYSQGKQLYRVKARTAVMAGGCWTTKHIVRDLPAAQRDAYGQFYRSPCMMANVALRNWRFLYKMGI